MNDQLDPNEDPSTIKWGIFYFNPKDDRVIGPKRTKGLGYTLNFARPATYFILIVVGLSIFFIGKY